MRLYIPTAELDSNTEEIKKQIESLTPYDLNAITQHMNLHQLEALVAAGMYSMHQRVYHTISEDVGGIFYTLMHQFRETFRTAMLLDESNKP